MPEMKPYGVFATALRKGDNETADALMEEMLQLEGVGPLCRAAEHGRLDLVEQFLKNRVVDLTEEHARLTPLAAAAGGLQLDCVQRLLRESCLTQGGKKTPYDMAHAIKAAIIRRKSQETEADKLKVSNDILSFLALPTLIAASKEGKTDLVKRVLEGGGIDFNVKYDGKFLYTHLKEVHQATPDAVRLVKDAQIAHDFSENTSTLATTLSKFATVTADGRQHENQLQQAHAAYADAIHGAVRECADEISSFANQAAAT